MIDDAPPTTGTPTTGAPTADRTEDPTATWHALASSSQAGTVERPLRPRTVYAQVAALTAVVVVAVALLGSFAAQRISEREAVNDAAQEAGLLADAVITPALRDGLVDQQPSAVAALDREVRQRLLGDRVVRVKIWRPDGTIVYSDEPRLVGRSFDLGEEEQEVLRSPATRAEVTDLSEPENVFERGQGKLLEVYRPVSTPDGHRLLFEIYAPYDVVLTRGSQIWHGFAGITITSLVAMVVLLLPVLWRLLDRLRRGQVQRELLLQQALDASNDERRRIAATLHDGVVQELAATSFVVSGAAARAHGSGQPELAGALDDAATAVRTGINGLRSLLVDIYPPSLDSTGLVQALGDLVDGYRNHEVDVALDAGQNGFSRLHRDGERLVFQTAQETVRNAIKHAAASRIVVRLEEAEDRVTLLVDDDGAGFDAERALADPEAGHFGLRLLADAARHAGADLWLASEPGAGTHWRLEVRR